MNIIHSIARGLAFFVAAFTLLNLIGTLFSPGFDANIWWIDLAFLRPAVATIFLTGASLALGAFGLGRAQRPRMRNSVTAVAGILMLITAYNAALFFHIWQRGRITPGFAVPLSLMLTCVFAVIFFAALFTKPHAKRAGPAARWLITGTFTASLVFFPLAQMLCFGNTDYRRPADAIVVFGAHAYQDGTPSAALRDRVLTAIQLYHEGDARLLIFSGGPGDGPISEPAAMRTLALAMGVPDQNILLDEQGLNTDLTVRNTVALFHDRGITRVLAVSHFYHLPRIKMTYARAGVDVYTVPVREGLPGTPFFMAREVAALWTYYLRPLWRA